MKREEMIVKTHKDKVANRRFLGGAMAAKKRNGQTNPPRRNPKATTRLGRALPRLADGSERTGASLPTRVERKHSLAVKLTVAPQRRSTDGPGP